MYHGEYITEDIYNRTENVHILDAIEHEELKVMRLGKVWWLEYCNNRFAYKHIFKEMKKLFPNLTYLTEVAFG